MTRGRFTPSDRLGQGTNVLLKHVNGMVHVGSPHGAAEHTNITRALWVTADALYPDLSTRVTIGTGLNQVPAVQLADGATQGVYFTLQFPTDQALSTVTVVPYWTPSVTDPVAHTVRWQIRDAKRVDGTLITGSGTTTAWTGRSIVQTLDMLCIDTGQATTNVTGATSIMRLSLYRVGADAADTYVGNVNLIGVRLDYGANE